MPVACCADCHADSGDEDAADPGDGEVAPAPHVRLFLLRGQELDLFHLGTGPLRGADLQEDVESLVVAALRDEPARRLGHGHHSDEQRDRGEGRDGEHVAPHALVVAPDVADDGVHDEGQHLADDDRQLATTGEAASALGGRQLGQVHRDGDRGAADREAEDHPRRDHHLEVPGEHTAEGADEEEDRQDDQRLLPAEGVVELAADERSDRGPGQQGARDQAFTCRAQPQVQLHRLQRTVDHAGVVAEQQAAEGGDDRDEVEPPLVRTGSERRQRHAAGFVGVHGLLHGVRHGNEIPAGVAKSRYRMQ